MLGYCCLLIDAVLYVPVIWCSKFLTIFENITVWNTEIRGAVDVPWMCACACACVWCVCVFACRSPKVNCIIFRTKNVYSHLEWNVFETRGDLYWLYVNERTNNQSGMNRKENIWIDIFHAEIARMDWIIYKYSMNMNTRTHKYIKTHVLIYINITNTISDRKMQMAD